MKHRSINALSASALLTFALSACSNESGSSSNEPNTTVAFDAEGNELRDLTYTYDFSFMDEELWPAVVMGQVINDDEDLIYKINEHPEILGWYMNAHNHAAATLGNPPMTKDLPFAEVEKYGKELCDKYSADDLELFLRNPLAESTPLDEEVTNASERFSDYFIFKSDDARSYEQRVTLSSTFEAAIFAGCGSELPTISEGGEVISDDRKHLFLGNSPDNSLSMPG